MPLLSLRLYHKGDHNFQNGQQLLNFKVGTLNFKVDGLCSIAHIIQSWQDGR